MMVYTLVGSLLMLVAAIATAVLAQDQSGELTFAIADLRANVAPGRQPGVDLLLLRRGLPGEDAGLPAARLDAGRVPRGAHPRPGAALGVLSKVAAYGFLRVVLPIFPDATVQFQELILVIAPVSILYGSAMAFTQTNVRLIAGYSSIAQLGFITLGDLRPARRRRRRRDPADGQPRIVVVPLFLIIVLLAERYGSEDLREMGGGAMLRRSWRRCS